MLGGAIAHPAANSTGREGLLPRVAAADLLIGPVFEGIFAFARCSFSFSRCHAPRRLKPVPLGVLSGSEQCNNAGASESRTTDRDSA